ncbi:MAG: right-handed parallel beta-helix repeat-containing protein [Planctomycetes bacterium]|nr:right-handed parallel beta-helix repeat-containing protein [Planctomycetota bacterium]
MRSSAHLASGFMGAMTLFAALAAQGGPLTPLPGPVAPTPGPEPRTPISPTTTPGDNDASPSLFKITQPGSYYLTGNITGVSGKHGIEIVASGVTLDLNGFDLVGVPGMGVFDGVSVTVDLLRGIAVRNGSVRGWGDAGVDLGFISYGCFVADLRVSDNAGLGINGGVACAVTGCTAMFNTLSGIRTNNGSTVSGCSLYFNAGNGIQVNNGCTISTCSVYLSTLDGILTGIGCRVTDSSVFTNLQDGIQVGEGSAVSGCSATSNNAFGVNASNNCTISNVTADHNSFDGISVGAGFNILDCSATFNSRAGIIALGDGGTVRGCTARSNTFEGIYVRNDYSVSYCSSSLNGRTGIATLDSGLVSHCNASKNGSSGILVNNSASVIENDVDGNSRDPFDTGIGVSSSCRVEGNRCSDGATGIRASGTLNIIVRNTCRANTTNWSIASNNVFGPIIDRRFPGSGAVSGNAAASTLGSTDPNANFTH